MKSVNETLLDLAIADIEEQIEAAERGRKDAIEESKAHKGAMASRYDTFKEEAQYLAGGFAARIQELSSQLSTLKSMQMRLAAQLKTRLKSVAICDEWTGKMLQQVEEWQRENVHSSQSFVQNLKSKLSDTQEKLDKLVSAYIDGDIPKENYLAKKEDLLKQKVSLANDLDDFGRTGKNWLQPLRA